MLETVLAHDSVKNTTDIFAFGWNTSQFALDNCATYHICNNKSLFIGRIEPISNVGISGVGGTVIPVGIGRIHFTLRDLIQLIIELN